MTIVLGSAIVCSRATKFVVSPIVGVLLRYALADQIADDDHARTDGDAGLQRRTSSGLQVPDGPENGEAGKYCPLCIALVRCRVSEIREHPVAQVLGDHATEGFYLVRATGVERGDYVALVFGIQPC